ncbi:aspartic peptidase domain-containing protein [Syncephalastrum racemosum]|uniref:Aspartic peptidase domain-containing protein n=1 Tax=Syncephalastrum racemosum TaxID=13706 RepID=A0A1X2HRY8_SYNRA|nr:aspartic peptidase domain-containing protein [Syncephalastrum racemosum]
MLISTAALAAFSCLVSQVSAAPVVADQANSLSSAPGLITTPLYTRHISKENRLARRADANDTVDGAYPIQLTELVIPAKIGTPAKDYLLIFDTGSSDTWVGSNDCDGKGGCAGLKLYNPKESSSYEKNAYEFNAAYGSAIANGSYFYDTFTVGGATLKHQTLAYADRTTGTVAEQDSSQKLRADGLLGASFRATTAMYDQYNKSYDPVPMALYKAGRIAEPVFSVQIGPINPDMSAKELSSLTKGNQSLAGSVTFGGYDASLVSGDFLYAPIYEEQKELFGEIGAWYIGAESFGLKSKNGSSELNLKLPSGRSVPVLVDSGTTMNIFPEYFVDKLLQHWLPSAEKQEDGSYELKNCHAASTNKTLTYTFANGDELRYPIDDMLVQLPDDQCIIAIMGSPDNQTIIGNVFMSSYVTTFDWGKNRIGFAPVKK